MMKRSGKSKKLLSCLLIGLGVWSLLSVIAEQGFSSQGQQLILTLYAAALIIIGVWGYNLQKI
jgi:hypothetical protein